MNADRAIAGKPGSRWQPAAAFVAHRGGGTLAPENTLAAMRCGWDHGYRMFEFDARLAADGSVVLMHDDTAQRTTDGQGRVSALDAGALAALDAGAWHSARYAGEAVPTLGRIARWLRANGAAADLEIKADAGQEAEAGGVIGAEAAALWDGVDTPPLVTSFSEAALAAARETAPHLPRALLLSAPGIDWLERCLALDCVGVVVDHTRVDAPLISKAHARGLSVMAYTVNDPNRAALLRAWGLDAVITDALERISPRR